MGKVKRLPPRNRVKEEDRWDLTTLYSTDQAWEKALKRLERKIKGYEKFPGTLSKSPQALAACLKFDSEVERLAERLGNYAYLKTTEDQTNSDYQAMLARFRNVATRGAEAASFIRPEILAMQGEMADAASRAFRQLHDADLKFGFVTNEKGEKVELSNATFVQLLHCNKRSVRKNAFQQYYQQFQAHENTLAATLSGSIQKDIYYARARGYSSALDAALYPDNVPQSVYDNLIASVRKHLPAVHRFYDLRRRKMKLRDIHHYDCYVPILSDIESRHTWKQAVTLILDALQPLGSQYTDALAKGLNGRWCDRYPNQGKQSGAFSYGTYDGLPYIMMNYKPDVLNDVFTLAHEAGHSMHSYFSIKGQPFEYYNYTIFVAEVASTFNEQLLSKHLLQRAKTAKERAYLLNNEIDDIRSTIIRQTMFAEFEKITHEMAESGEPLTVAAFKDVYAKLLSDYFGPDFSIDDELSLECFRIPHFYRAFYVYKYATGMSAAIALSERVVHGGRHELNDYLGFLKGGCSKYPLDLLRGAGVDMEQPEPVDTALSHFSELVDELDQLL